MSIFFFFFLRLLQQSKFSHFSERVCDVKRGRGGSLDCHRKWQGISQVKISGLVQQASSTNHGSLGARFVNMQGRADRNFKHERRKSSPCGSLVSFVKSDGAD